MPDSSDQPSPARDPYAAWRHPSYRLFAIGWFLLTFSTQISTVAIGLYLYRQTGDPLALGGVGLVQALPVILLAIPGGQLADRMNRKRIMVATLAMGTLVSGGVAVAVHHSVGPGMIYLLLGLGAITQALGGPSRAALLPQIVGPRIFDNAVTWNTTIFHIALMSGPAVGGILVGLDQTATTAFVVVTICRILSLAVIGLMVVPTVVRPAESISLATLVAGVEFVFRTKPILAAITLDLFAVLLGGLTYLLPMFAKDILQLQRPDDAVGFLRSAEAVGAVTMAMLLAHLPPLKHAGRTMLWAVGGFGAATIVFGLSQSFWLSLGMMFLIGAFDNVSVVVRHTMVQMLTPDAMRGRVSAVNNVFIVASNDLGGFESGVAARLFGPVIAVVGGGIGTLLVVAGSAWRWPQLLRIGKLRDLKAEDMAVIEETSVEELADRAV